MSDILVHRRTQFRPYGVHGVIGRSTYNTVFVKLSDISKRCREN